MSLQLLPIKEIGEILFTNQITEEEVIHDVKLAKQPIFQISESTPDLSHITDILFTAKFCSTAQCAILPAPISDVLVPPPNFI